VDRHVGAERLLQVPLEEDELVELALRVRELAERVREVAELVVEQPVRQPEARLVAVGHAVDVAQRDAGGLQTELDRLVRELPRLLLAIQPLFLDGGDELPVDHERGRRVVSERVDPEDLHGYRRFSTCSTSQKSNSSSISTFCSRSRSIHSIRRPYRSPPRTRSARMTYTLPSS